MEMVEDQNLIYALIPLLEEGYNWQELRILKLVYKKKLNISEISKTLGIDYKNTHRYIHKLNTAGLIILDPSKPSKGKTISITLSVEMLVKIKDELEKIILRKDTYVNIPELLKENKRKIRYIESMINQK
jgi:predicted transcriptional regulator